MTTLKTRLSEAQEIAKHLAERFLFDKVVDTIEMCIRDSSHIAVAQQLHPLRSQLQPVALRIKYQIIISQTVIFF